MTTTVEVKFDGSTWTDVTSYVRNVQVRRGRANDLSAVDPGTLTVELDNNDGRFTPTNTQGAYSPNVKPAVEVRVTQNGGAGPDDYRLFTGKAQRWEPRWDVGGRPVVVLEAVDGFEQLSNVDVPVPYWFEVDRDADGHWPLDEPSGEWRDRIGGRNLLTGEGSAGLTRAESGNITMGPGSVSLQYDGGVFGPSIVSRADVPTSWSGNSNDLTFSCWISLDEYEADGFTTLNLAEIRDAVTFARPWAFRLSASKLSLSLGTGVSEILQSDVSTWTAGQTYHVAFHWDSSTETATFYRNGVSIGSDTSSSGTPNLPTNPRLELLSTSEASWVTRMSEVALWVSDQSSLISDLYDAGGGWASDLPGVRIGRVLDWAGWDASLRDIDDGTTPLAAVTSGTALAACQDAAAADGGVFFIDAAGDATFQGRRDRWESDTALVETFDDDGTDTGYQTVGWRYDTTLMANRVTVDSNTQGTSDGTAEDTTSQAAYGLRTLTISTISNNSADNAERADWELSRRKDPHLRLEEVGFLVADTVQEDAAGTLELQSLVEVNRRPGSGQDDLTVTMRVASIVHTISDGGSRWQARFGLLDADTDQPGIYGTAVYGSDYYGY